MERKDMNKILRRILFYLWQCSWGGLQTLLGFVIFLINYRKPHSFFHGAIVTEWDIGGGLSLGPFIFLNKSLPRFREEDRLLSREEVYDRMLVHEFGHSIQSMILGPLYLFVIGIPSLTWNKTPRLQNRRIAKERSYYSFYTEWMANSLGERFTKEKSVGQPRIF